MPSWEDVYRSDAQGAWALIALPIVYLGRVLLVPPAGPGAEPAAARFVRVWAVVFLIETILDPLATGPVLRALGLRGPIADNAMLPFVLLGDFRVFVLVGSVAAPARPLAGRVGEAAMWTAVIPLVAGAGWAALDAAWASLPGQALWLLYEIAFVALALWLRARLVPRRTAAPAARAYLRAVLLYVALYYGLWAAADVLILAGDDRGWALRMVPNQLYYAFWIPFAVERFFAARYAPTSTAVQASR